MRTAHKVGTAGCIAIACAFVQPWEGLWTTAQIDAIGTGHPVTYCYGATGNNVKAGEKFTPQECSALLEKTLPTYLAQIKPCIKVDIPDKVQAALLSAAYNAGPAAVCHSPMVKKINAGDIIGGCEAFRGWYVRASGRVVKGLINRRAGESQLCSEGATDPKPEPISLWTRIHNFMKGIF